MRIVIGMLCVLAGAACGAGVEKDGWYDFNKNGRKDVFEDRAKPIDARIEDLLGQMSVLEKAGQLNQLILETANSNRQFQAQHRGEVGSYIHGVGNPFVRNAYQKDQIENARLGVPIIFGMDVIHGDSMGFPSSIGLACAFEPELFEKTQAVAAREARAGGVDWVFAPMCDLARDIRWGRVVETCGEDPYLSALCNVAQVRGFQGPKNDVSDPTRVAACLKHYTGYSAVTGGRDYNDSQLGEWDLRNQHLPSFRAAVAAGAKTVMSSFNSIDGIPACANYHTLTEILRGEWGFKGFVVSDWEAVGQLRQWGFAKDKADATVLALNAGNDMDMKDECFVPSMEQCIADGRVKMETLDQAVRNVLRVKFELGLFERPYCDAAAYEPLYKADRLKEAPLARECARKSVVMLKNAKAVLPIVGAKKIALIGPNGEDWNEPLGSWRCHTWRGRVYNIRQGLEEQLPAGAKLTVVKGCSLELTKPMKTLQDGRKVVDQDAAPCDQSFDPTAAVAAASEADVVVMALGEPRGWTGEATSRCTLDLTGYQQQLFDAVAKTGKPIVTIVYSGRPLVLPEIWEKSAAVLYAWQPGCEAGHALADLIYGRFSPSGRLSTSVPRGIGWVPAYYNRPTSGRPWSSCNYTRETEVHSKFAFGYGLTYGDFRYSSVTLDGNVASCTVKNVGKAEATETVQLYIRATVCHRGWRPQRELRGFRKVTLKPGEETKVSFPITAETLACTDRDGKDYADPGVYQVWIAKDSDSGKPVELTF